MIILSSRLRKSLIFLLLLVLAPTLHAIVIRHDKADSKYQADPKRYPQIFYLHTRNQNKVCLATLIDKKWALTAAHCAEDTPLKQTIESGNNYTLEIDGKQAQISQLVIHPNYKNSELSDAVDLALMKFETDISGVEPIALYRRDDEQNMPVWFVGWGSTGWGTVGKKGNDGKFRRAQNVVSKAGQWLQFEFDDPRVINHQALELEGTPGRGDSGGPALLESELGLWIVGVAIGEIEDPDTPNLQGVYGAISLYERVSQHQRWIDEVIGR